MKQIDISFCIPIYNVSAYIHDCLQSILSEISEIEAEIICIDDCSTDDSWRLVKEAADQYINIICNQNSINRGVSYSRNKAIEMAQGKYIWFVDPDDLLAPGIVKQFLNHAEENHADIVIGNYLRVEEAFSISHIAESMNHDVVFKHYDTLIHPSDSNGKTMNAIWAGLFKTEFLREHHVLFRENMIAQEDTLFYYEVEQCFPSVYKTDAVCYFYRQRQSSVMHHKSEERMEKYYSSMIIMLEVYKEYYDSGKYRDKIILEEKIHRSYENISACLAKCIDHAFVKKNLQELKQKGYYPYPLRMNIFKQKGSKIKEIMDYVLPIEPLFWFVHYVYAFINRRRFK